MIRVSSKFQKKAQDYVDQGLVSNDFIRGMAFYRDTLHDVLELIKSTKMIEIELWESWIQANLPALYEKAKAEISGQMPKRSTTIIDRILDKFIDNLLQIAKEKGYLDEIVEKIATTAKELKKE